MRPVLFCVRVSALLVLSYATVLGLSAQQLEEISIYNFAGLASGSGDGPFPNVIFDKQGNLYGTTSRGGSGTCIDRNKNIVGCGTVFELTPAGGVWTVGKQYDFGGGQDGQKPYGAVILDAAGNVYGTTLTGGGLGNCSDEGILVGCGTVFRLTPNASGGWTKTLLHAFNVVEGAYGRGNVFAIRRSNGSWSFSSIYDFGANVNDGDYSVAGVTVDSQGNLYGTTFNGGKPTCDCGIAFKLVHSTGSWRELILHRFNGLSDGGNPYAPLVLGSGGRLFGTALSGGNQGCFPWVGCGVVFALSRTATGGWKETQLHGFTEGTGDGTLPNGLVIDGSGNIYGTTFSGGTTDNGTVFKLSRADWTWSILHSFSGGTTDGAQPNAAVTLDSLGNLYGTTAHGGAYGLGAVFEITQ